MKYDVAKLQEFFLRAAAATYAGGQKAKFGFGGEKVFELEDGRFCYRDGYWVNGEWSGGQTMHISFQERFLENVAILQNYSFANIDV